MWKDDWFIVISAYQPCFGWHILNKPSSVDQYWKLLAVVVLYVFPEFNLSQLQPSCPPLASLALAEKSRAEYTATLIHHCTDLSGVTLFGAAAFRIVTCFFQCTLQQYIVLVPFFFSCIRRRKACCSLKIDLLWCCSQQNSNHINREKALHISHH